MLTITLLLAFERIPSIIATGTSKSDPSASYNKMPEVRELQDVTRRVSFACD
jgi:hypothetical protein